MQIDTSIVNFDASAKVLKGALLNNLLPTLKSLSPDSDNNKWSELLVL
jgi:hypothetical protein